MSVVTGDVRGGTRVARRAIRGSHAVCIGGEASFSLRGGGWPTYSFPSTHTPYHRRGAARHRCCCLWPPVSSQSTRRNHPRHINSNVHKVTAHGSNHVPLHVGRLCQRGHSGGYETAPSPRVEGSECGHAAVEAHPVPVVVRTHNMGVRECVGAAVRQAEPTKAGAAAAAGHSVAPIVGPKHHTAPGAMQVDMRLNERKTVGSYACLTGDSCRSLR